MSGPYGSDVGFALGLIACGLLVCFVTALLEWHDRR